MVRCPFHSDSTPSLAVYPDHAYCFGACGRSWDIFSWVMQRDGLTFAEARDRLARERGMSRPHWTPDDERKADERREVEDVLRIAADYYAAQLWNTSGAEALANARSRAWTDDTIREARLGYADGGLAAHLHKVGVDLDVAKRAGLIRDDGRDFFHHRLVFPHLRRGGHVIYLSTRTLSNAEPKYLNLPGQKQLYYNAPALDHHSATQPLVIVEGQADAVTLGQWGVASVALCGTSLSEHDLANARKYETVHVALDADDAGRRAAADIANTLGPLTRIITLPDGVKDPNAWALAGATADHFACLMAEALTWLDLKIESTAALSGSERDAALREVFGMLAGLDAFALARYKSIVADKLGIRAREFNSFLRAIKQTAKEPESEPTPEVVEGRFPILSPALDFCDGLAVVTVPALVLIDGKPQHLPYLVTSTREIIPAENAGLVELGGQRVLFASPPQVVGGEARWDWDDVQRYIQGDAPDPVKTFLAVEELYDRYLDFREAYTSDVLSLWTMGTYVHRLFEAYPYVALMGPMASGKTKTEDVTMCLAFNMRMSSSMSSAALYRVIQATRASLAIDEAERLANPKDPLASDFRLLLNAGYKKGAPAMRYNPDTGQIEEFDLYGPKILASIRGVEYVLESRCIVINMLRTTSAKGNTVVRERDEEWVAVRHGLYCFALTHFADVRDIYLNDSSICVLNNRQNELWRPLLAIAAFLSRYTGGPSDLLDKIKAFAERKAHESDGTGLPEREEALLLALNELITTEGKSKAEISTKAICEAMGAYTPISEKEVSDGKLPQWIGFAIRRLGLLPDRKRKWHTRDGTQYLVFAAEVQDVLARYGLESSK